MDKNIYNLFLESTGICTDTRAIETNVLFVCIKGDNFDGNKFATKALENGASHVVVDNPSHFNENGKMTLVQDSVLFLQELANYHRKQFNIPVIGITGSNGKTTTKELVNAVLSTKYKVLATQGNLNNHLGVPFTLLRLNDEHQVAIIEMGASKPKDIEELCNIAEPTYGIISNIGKAHLEGFIDYQGVINTKKELYESVSRVNGTLFINQDDDLLLSLIPKNTKNISYGTSKSSTIEGELLSLSPFVNMKWKSGKYSSSELKTKMVGKYNFYNYLAAISFGIEFDIEPTKISSAIESYTPTNNRSQIKKTQNNTLILDCYNANPTSMRTAIESFAMITESDKLFIIGDMKELGEVSHSEHQEIIDLIERLNLNGYTVGSEFLKIHSNNVMHKFSCNEDLLAHIDKHPIKNQLILLKGSRSIGLEIVEQVL